MVRGPASGLELLPFSRFVARQLTLKPARRQSGLGERAGFSDGEFVAKHIGCHLAALPGHQRLAERSGWFQLAGSVAMDEWIQVTGDNPTVESVAFLDPDRDVDSYMGSLGQEPTYEAFIAASLSQSRLNWRDEYTAQAVNAYVQEGFTPVN